jgi:hypothetical protein
VGTADFVYECRYGLQVIAKGGSCLKFQGKAHVLCASLASSLHQRRANAIDVLLCNRCGDVARQDKSFDIQLITKAKPPLEKIPCLLPRSALTGEQATLQTCNGRLDATTFQQSSNVVYRMRFDVMLEFCQPNLDVRTLAGCIIFDIFFEG